MKREYNMCSVENSYLGGSNADCSFIGLLGRLWRKLPTVLVFTFAVSFIIVFLIHGYCFTNFLTNHDNALISNGAGGIIENGGAVSSGRFLLTTVNAISSRYTMPWINGLLSSFYFALAVCAIVVLFNVQHKFSCVLISLLLASFPTAASTFSFMYTADAYFFALMLSCFAALVTHRYRMGFIPGSLMVASTLGIYQAYFPFAASLLVFSLIFDTYRSAEKPISIMFKCVRAVIALAAGLVIYKAVLDIALKVSDAELTSYLGLDHMWYISVWDLRQRLSDAYRYSFLVYKANDFFPDAAHVIYIIELLCLVALATIQIIRKRIYKDTFRLFVIFLLVMTAPLACSLMFVMSSSVHTVMIYSLALPLVIGAAALDKAELSEIKAVWAHTVQSLVCTVLLVSLVAIAFINTIVVNKAYLKMDIVYESTYALCTKLSERMESHDGYRIGMPVVLAGSLTEENRPTLHEEMTELDLMAGIPTELGLLRTNIISGFCRYYIGMDIVEADSITAKKILADPALKTMSIYPYNGSIDIIDGVMVVKLGNNYQN